MIKNTFENSFFIEILLSFILLLLDKIIPHLHLADEQAEGPKVNLKKSTMLILAVTLHNIPEGLAVGIAFGSIYYGITGATTLSAIMLAIGIGLQNFPEGSAVSIPLLREGISRKKAFFYGQLSAIVEPIFGVIGALLVLKVRILLPFFLSFAAGAMIFVVVQELIPESQMNKNNSIMSLLVIVGFVIMMILDTAL